MKKITTLLAVLLVAGCASKGPKPKPPLEAQFGNTEQQLKDFSDSFNEIKKSSLSAEEKAKRIAELAKQLEDLENNP